MSPGIIFYTLPGAYAHKVPSAKIYRIDTSLEVVQLYLVNNIEITLIYIVLSYFIRIKLGKDYLFYTIVRSYIGRVI